MTSSNQPRLSMTVARESWPLAEPFRITRHVFTTLEVVVVTLTDGVHEGRGEAAGVYYLQDTPDRMLVEIERVRTLVEAGIDRAALACILTAGGARNAIDCALWDLQAKQAGSPVWALAGLEAPRPLLTTYTIGANLPHLMAVKAAGWPEAQAIKLKLTGEAEDAERVRAVRLARPDIWLGVDANQGYSRVGLERLLPTLVEARVQLLEQPFPIEQDAMLDGLQSPIPLAADESVQTLQDIASLAGRVDVINIKLDKCGGLTEGLAMVAEARRLGLKVMVGNMLGTGLAMAPAMLIGQACDVVDLDGPMVLVRDRDPAVSYDNGLVWCRPETWGSPVPETVGDR